MSITLAASLVREEEEEVGERQSVPVLARLGACQSESETYSKTAAVDRLWLSMCLVQRKEKCQSLYRAEHAYFFAPDVVGGCCCLA